MWRPCLSRGLRSLRLPTPSLRRALSGPTEQASPPTEQRSSSVESAEASSRASLLRGPKESDLSVFESSSGFTFSSKGLLLQALTDKTYLGGAQPTNERLEYLGEAVLEGLVAMSLTVNSYMPSIDEKTFLDFLNAYTSRNILAMLGSKIGVDKLVRYSTENEISKTTVIAKSMKALIGALYQEKGPAAVRVWLETNLLPMQVDVAKFSQDEQDWRRIREERQANKKKGVFEQQQDAPVQASEKEVEEWQQKEKSRYAPNLRRAKRIPKPYGGVPQGYGEN